MLLGPGTCWLGDSGRTLTSMLRFSIEQVAIMVVMQLPPRLSRSTEVIMEFLYGTCCRFFSDSARITCNTNTIAFVFNPSIFLENLLHLNRD